MAALRQKQAHENELDRIAGTRLTLETQVSLVAPNVYHLSHLDIRITVLPSSLPDPDCLT